MISSLDPKFDDWLTEATSRERWFTNELPKWKNLPDSETAQEDRRKRSRLLRRHGHTDIAVRLAECRPNSRCMSGACPECSRAVQRVLVRALFSELKPPSDFCAVSLIPDIRKSVGQLHKLDLLSFREALMSDMRSCRLSCVGGGIDISLNEDATGEFAPYWSLHGWILTSQFNRARWEQKLRSRFCTTPTIHRPIKIIDWDGSRKALGYAFKYSFSRRVSHVAIRRYRAGFRKCRATKPDRLRSAECAELYVFLDSYSISARVLIRGLEEP